uniref:Uncharacterized protein n=1 Tax=Peronospora matthiolae TaxID=2874970 RepID=A0AAV1V2H7_9STRA
MAAGFLSAAAAASAGRDCFSVGFAARVSALGTAKPGAASSQSAG